MLIRRMYWWSFWWVHFLIKNSMFLASVMIFNGQSEKSVPKYESTQVCAYIFSLLVFLDPGFTHMLWWSFFSSVSLLYQWQLCPPLRAFIPLKSGLSQQSASVWHNQIFLAVSFCKYTLNISRSTLLVNIFLWLSTTGRRAPQHIRP